MSDDLIEDGAGPDFVIRSVWGPSCIRSAVLSNLDVRLAPFEALLEYPEQLHMFTWWRDQLIANGHLPIFEPRWWSSFTDISDRIFMRERVMGTTQVRIRYVGEEIERRQKGHVQAGKDAHQVTQEDEDIFWNRIARLFVEGRPRLICGDMGPAGRSHVKMIQLDLPMCGTDEDRHDVRFNIGLHVYP